MKRSGIIIGVLLLTAVNSAANRRQQSSIESAKTLFDQGHYTEARDLLRAQIPKSPNDPDIYYWLGRCEFELFNNDAAITDAERAVQLDSGNSGYHYFLGTTYGRKAEFANLFSGLSLARKTEHEFVKAVELDSGNMLAQRDLISYCIQAPSIAGGGEEKAEEQITKLNEINPLQAHLALMELYEDKKKWGQASDEANAALAAKPVDVEPYLEVVEYYEDREEVAQMRGALAAIPRSLASDPHVNFYRGVAGVIAGDHPEEAETLIKTYLAKEPQPRREDRTPLSTAHTWLGRLYEKTGRRQAAAAEYRIAVKLDPHDKAAHEGLKRVGS